MPMNMLMRGLDPDWVTMQIRHKAGLDRRMSEIEEAIRLFSQKKVLVQVSEINACKTSAASQLLMIV